MNAVNDIREREKVEKSRRLFRVKAERAPTLPVPWSTDPPPSRCSAPSPQFFSTLGQWPILQAKNKFNTYSSTPRSPPKVSSATHGSTSDLLAFSRDALVRGTGSTYSTLPLVPRSSKEKGFHHLKKVVMPCFKMYEMNRSSSVPVFPRPYSVLPVRQFHGGTLSQSGCGMHDKYVSIPDLYDVHLYEGIPEIVPKPPVKDDGNSVKRAIALMEHYGRFDKTGKVQYDTISVLPSPPSNRPPPPLPLPRSSSFRDHSRTMKPGRFPTNLDFRACSAPPIPKPDPFARLARYCSKTMKAIFRTYYRRLG